MDNSTDAGAVSKPKRARKERPLTEGQICALLAAEPTLFGDIKVVPGLYGRSVSGLRRRGLVGGERAHSYLTDAGLQKVAELSGQPA